MRPNDRIRLIRSNLRLTQYEFGRQLGLTQGGYADIERGKNNVSNTIRQLLHEKFNVNLNWLDNGVGNMYLPPNTKDSGDNFKVSNNTIIHELINNLIKENRDLHVRLSKLKDKMSELGIEDDSV